MDQEGRSALFLAFFTLLPLLSLAGPPGNAVSASFPHPTPFQETKANSSVSSLADSFLSAPTILKKYAFKFKNSFPLLKTNPDSQPLIKNRIFKTFPPQNHCQRDVVTGIYAPVLAIISLFSKIWLYLKNLFSRKNPTCQKRPPFYPEHSTLLTRFRKFTYRELSAATKHFNISELIGRGIYASVYKATFPDSSTTYVVKRFDQNSFSRTSYHLEVSAIHRLHHPNILELKGWCDENPEEPLLVYDYMPNGSLEEALWNRSRPLLWPQRFKIAVGVARALAYLHQECAPPVIHLDIKEENVMLDAEFNPKLGDFGLAISAPPYMLRRSRTEIDPPECEPYGDVTVKADVYLYGFMLLGLFCRKMEAPKRFLKRLRRMNAEGSLLEAVDKKLSADSFSEEMMLRVLKVGLRCAEKNTCRRPSMELVLHFLDVADEDGTDDSEQFTIEI